MEKLAPEMLSNTNKEELKRICEDKWVFKQYKKRFGKRQMIRLRKLYRKVSKAEGHVPGPRKFKAIGDAIVETI